MLVMTTLAACSGSVAPSLGSMSPVETSLAYFDALNRGDMSLADALRVPDGRPLDPGDQPPHDEFQNLVCRPASEVRPDLHDTETWAYVACEFDIREDWSGFSAGHYGWGVELHRQPPGSWLIYSEGQG
jgi:hypothetical protein